MEEFGVKALPETDSDGRLYYKVAAGQKLVAPGKPCGKICIWSTRCVGENMEIVEKFLGIFAGDCTLLFKILCGSLWSSKETHELSWGNLAYISTLCRGSLIGTYRVEADASAASYPLAIAAATGGCEGRLGVCLYEGIWTGCEITVNLPYQSLGSRPVQGETLFVSKILKPMGCQVERHEEGWTTVKGEFKSMPSIGNELC